MAQGSNKALGIGLGIGALLFFLSRSSKGSPVERSIFAPRQLTAHFKLEEFLKGHPDMPKIGVTKQELANLTLVANLLEKVRPISGPIYITSGIRPLDLTFRTDKGLMTIDQILVSKGYQPSATSDHHDGTGVDFSLQTQEAYLPTVKALAALPETRQIILYLSTKKEGNTQTTLANHIHVSARKPNQAKISDPNYSYVKLDGKRLA